MPSRARPTVRASMACLFQELSTKSSDGPDARTDERQELIGATGHRSMGDGCGFVCCELHFAGTSGTPRLPTAIVSFSQIGLERQDGKDAGNPGGCQACSVRVRNAPWEGCRKAAGGATGHASFRYVGGGPVRTHVPDASWARFLQNLSLTVVIVKRRPKIVQR